MGNAVAYLVLLAWPAICVAFFARLSVERALIWSILGGYMLLPPITALDLPLVPALDKFTIPSLSALMILLFVLGKRPNLIPQQRSTRLLMLGLLLGTIPTVLTNGEAITFNYRTDVEPIQFVTAALPGLRLIDIVSVLSEQLIMLIPFLLARHYLASEVGLKALTIGLMAAGLIYSVPAVIEVRLSPQLNLWIYGFFQHDFQQMMREGGFRPIVFMPHALWLALFFVMAICAAAALLRGADHHTRLRYGAALLLLLVMIYLCKSLASQVYTLLLVPLILFAPLRWQIRVAGLMAAFAVVYPMLRGFGLIPLDWILSQAEAYNPARAQSLGYRFNNEEQLLTRAAEKPFFGWGEWGRNLIRDPQTGQIWTIPDGRWILIFGSFGWVGYISQMGLIACPIVIVWLGMRHAQDGAVSPLIGPLCLMLAITMMDLLLNDTMVPMTWLIAGAILGYGERLLAGTAEQRRAEPMFGEGPVIGRKPDSGKRTLI